MCLLVSFTFVANKLAGASPPTLTSDTIGVPSSPGFSCVSTATYTECGDPGNPKACFQAPTYASGVNTAAITMTTSDMRPSCNAGYKTYSATAHAAIPTQRGPLKFLIPVADDQGSDWNFVIGGNDARNAVESWKVGNDNNTEIESGKGGKDLDIRWNVPDDSNGTYVELQLQASQIAKNVTFTANGGITPCMPDCRDNATTTTDIDGMICTHYPCHPTVCEQGPMPEPQATCELVRRDVLFWPLYFDVSILANGHSWMNDGGKKLKEEVKGCGAITGWHSRAIDVTTENNWTARHRFDFTLPVFLTGDCVERAIASAGGPSGIKCKKAHHIL